MGLEILLQEKGRKAKRKRMVGFRLEDERDPMWGPRNVTLGLWLILLYLLKFYANSTTLLFAQVIIAGT